MNLLDLSKLVTVTSATFAVVFILNGCSDADEDVPDARTRKRGKDVVGCDIYLGEKSPFTVASYDVTDDKGYALVSAICGPSKSPSHVLHDGGGMRVREAKDCEELQKNEREEFTEGKALAALYSECKEHNDTTHAEEDGTCQVVLWRSVKSIDFKQEASGALKATRFTCFDDSVQAAPEGFKANVGYTCNDLKEKVGIARSYDTFVEMVTGTTLTNPCIPLQTEPSQPSSAAAANEKPANVDYKEGTMTYRTVSIYVRDVQPTDMNSGTSFIQLTRSERAIRSRS
ncbi:hypothetical protein FOL47_010670 [Perkinsus chesapeaki]|uniref:Uncharacterized protein n=1 Tax=Perkinsus chesapeaki TaxID=330153 RepID=A0A7J6L139_PERCH|nr:hypothetical protein FOL47_010670 [Perkinsus chesapeaki]